MTNIQLNAETLIDALPAEMRTAERWICWPARHVPRDGITITEIGRAPHSQARAWDRHIKPHMDLEGALAACDERNEAARERLLQRFPSVDGDWFFPAYKFSADDNYIGIEFAGERGYDSDGLTGITEGLLADFRTYAEKSARRRNLNVVFRAPAIAESFDIDKCSVYAAGRLMPFSGQPARPDRHDTPKDVRDWWGAAPDRNLTSRERLVDVLDAGYRDTPDPASP